jgi:hypothetical protein
MKVGDVFGTLTVDQIVYRQRRDGTQGAPLLVHARCKCGVKKSVLPATLTRTKNALKSCGGKGCRARLPSQPRPAKPKKPESEIWYCKRRGAAE